MNIKKKLKRFFTLTHKADDGFTLVELIVVIAILAILAGVGTVGYGGYVKYSNRAMDKKLVKEICYGIDVASKSYAFSIDEVSQAGTTGAQIPVGFIVLSNTSDANTIESSNDCKEGTIKIYAAETKSLGKLTGYNKLSTVKICTTHSNCSALPTTAHEDYKGSYYIKDFSTDPTTQQNTLKGYKVYTMSNCPGETDGTYYGAYSTDADGVLHDIMVATFGDNYATTVRLRSDEWTVSSIPSFWSNATETWENVQSLADMMYELTSNRLYGGTISNAMNIGQYDSSADIVYSVAGAVQNSFADKQAFVDQWASYGQAENDISGGDDFGIDETYTGREYYSAMRGSYNNCVASYVKQHHSTNGYTQEEIDKHVADLAGYGESAGDLVTNKVDLGDVGNAFVSGIVNSQANANFPRQLCKASFTTTEGKSYGGDAANCAECARLYNEYVDSGADKADAAAVYDTFQTAANTELASGNKIGSNSDKFFSTYGNYLAQFEGLYSAAIDASEGGSSIVISVFYKDGLLGYEVSPNSVLN